MGFPPFSVVFRESQTISVPASFCRLVLLCGRVFRSPAKEARTPNVREADQNANVPLGPSASPKRRVTNPEELESEAGELPERSSAFPAQIKCVNPGLTRRIWRTSRRQVEKLAMHRQSGRARAEIPELEDAYVRMRLPSANPGNGTGICVNRFAVTPNHEPLRGRGDLRVQSLGA